MMLLLLAQIAAEVAQAVPDAVGGVVGDTLQLSLTGGTVAGLAYAIRTLGRLEAKVDGICDPDNGLTGRVNRLERWHDTRAGGRRSYDPPTPPRGS